MAARRLGEGAVAGLDGERQGPQGVRGRRDRVLPGPGAPPGGLRLVGQLPALGLRQRGLDGQADRGRGGRHRDRPDPGPLHRDLRLPRSGAELQLRLLRVGRGQPTVHHPRAAAGRGLAQRRLVRAGPVRPPQAGHPLAPGRAVRPLPRRPRAAGHLATPTPYAKGPGTPGPFGMYAAPMAGIQERYERLLEGGLALAADLSLPATLQRIVELAAGLTGARYGAMGVLGRDGTITDFVTTGITAEERAAMGHIPYGRGILGVLINDARPLRLRDIAEDPRSVGLPPNHPPMRSFLGVPVKAGGRVYGNLYMTEKAGGEDFDADDERALSLLAAQAGAAIEAANLFEQANDRAQRLEAIRAISTAILAGTDTGELLGLIVRHARALAGTDMAAVAVPVDGERLAVEAADGLLAGQLLGTVFPAEGSVTGDVIRTGKAVVLADAGADPRVAQPIVAAGAGPAVFIPLAVRGRILGTLTVANGRGGPLLRETEVQLVETFAEQAAVAIEYGRLQRELQRLALLEDRERIAKELHDGAIQALFAVGMGLQGSAALAASEELRSRLQDAVEEVDRVIRDLRNYIFGLRPGILADRQLDQALQRLCEEFQQRTGVVAIAEIDPQVAAELSSQAGDVVQLAREALSNVSRHAEATTCRVSLYRTEAGDVLEVDDDGRGFDPAAATGTGHGLRNVQERAERLGGQAEIHSIPGEGTRVRVTIPG